MPLQKVPIGTPAQEIIPSIARTVTFQNKVHKRNRERMLFCNVASMRNYDLDVVNDRSHNRGRYVRETGDAFEKINFHDFGDRLEKHIRF